MATTVPISQNIKNPQLSIVRSRIVAPGNYIYDGTLVGINANGYAIPANPNFPCIGVAITNASTPYIAGGWTVTVSYNHSSRFRLPGVQEEDVGKTVYAYDNNTLTLAVNSAVVGQIEDVDVDNGLALVRLTLYGLANFHADLTDLDTSGHPADIIAYDNAASGLPATEVQSAIDEVYRDVSILNNNSEITKEATGFTNPSAITVTYNSTTRKITLSGASKLYYLGEEILDLSTPWMSDAHAASPTSTLYLYYGSSGFQWSTSVWSFSDAQIAFVAYSSGSVFFFALRETHEFMPWQSHEEDHQIIGTYKTAGGVLSNYVLSSTTPINRRPDTSATTIKDEDLYTVNAAHTNKLYTQYYLSGAGGAANFQVDQADIVPLSGNRPYYNQFTGGVWQQTLIPNNNYMSVWLIALPVTADSASQKYRYVYIQGQSATSTLLAQRALQPSDLTLGDLENLSPEFVFINQVIINYSGGNWTIEEVREITGSRYSQVSSPSGNYLSSEHPDFIIIPYSKYTVIQGSYGYLTSTSEPIGLLYNSPGVDQDEINYTYYLDIGTYEIHTVTRTGGAGGIMKIYVDGVLVDTIDRYSASTVYNVPSTQTFVNASAGFKTIRVMVDGQNPSSGGYTFGFNVIIIKRIA